MKRLYSKTQLLGIPRNSEKMFVFRGFAGKMTETFLGLKGSKQSLNNFNVFFFTINE